MAHGSAQEVAAKWLSRIQQAQPEMQAGVARVSTAPGQAAANKRQKWVNALMDPATQDKWARNVASVSLGQWQSAMNDYGIARAAQGASAKLAKTEQAFASLLTYIDSVRSQVQAMPDDTVAGREQRALANMRLMAKYQRPGA
jgi:hypothetical protein